jgi:KDO2-lipid IV(A) lauroyltransferase
MGRKLHHFFMVRRSPNPIPLRQLLRWRLEALSVRLVLGVLRGRTHSAMKHSIRWAHRLTRPWLSKRHNTAIENLTRVYGEQLTCSQRSAIAEESINSFFLSCLESIIQPIDDALISAEGEGLDQLLALHRQGQGVIIGSLHLGCWDLGLRWLSQRLNTPSVIYRPARNPYSDALLNSARRANSHCNWISQFDAKAMFRCLRQGGSLVMMTDLYSGGSDLLVDFLGLSTRFAKGPAALSQKSGCPLFPVAQVRENNGRFRLLFGPALWPGQGDHALAEQMAALARWHEPWIQAYPEQYYWINRRWRPGDGSGERLRPLGPPAVRVQPPAGAEP